MRWKNLAAGAAAAALFLTPAAGATWGANYFPNIPLTTQEGKTVHFYDDLLKDKKVVINFIYTRCGDSCPLETALLARCVGVSWLPWLTWLAANTHNAVDPGP